MLLRRDAGRAEFVSESTTIILFDVGGPLSSDKMFVACSQCRGGMYIYADHQTRERAEYQPRHLFCVESA